MNNTVLTSVRSLVELSEIIDVVGLVLVLAWVSESMVEYLFGKPFQQYPDLGKKYGWLLAYVGMLVGVGLSFAYNLDIIAAMFGLEMYWVGTLLTGLMIGRGSNWLHEFVSKFLAKAVPPKPTPKPSEADVPA